MTGYLYIFLLGIRLWCSTSDTGFIHPDEWSQNGEIVAGDLFNINVRRSWEFDPESPSRSILPIYMSSGFLCALRMMGVRAPSALTLFLAQRLYFFLISLLLDLSFKYLLPANMTPTQRSRALCLWACSGFIFAFQIRTFSNSIEAVVLAGCLVCVKRLSASVLEPSQSAAERVHPSNTYLGSAFGIMLAFGAFTRVTFAPFALPSAIAFAYLSWLPLRVLPVTKQMTRLFVELSPIPIAFLAASVVFISFDTVYYSTFLPVGLEGNKAGLHLLSSPKLTPLNLLRYNLSTSNLSLHGVHPRWLHFVVNLPMVVGVSAFTVCIVSLKPLVHLERTKKEGAWRKVDDCMQRTYLATVFVGTAIISTAPHQEPRFLVPLGLPSMLVFSSALSHLPRRVSRTLIVGHVIQSIILTVIFSKLHQAGLLPALIELNRDIRIISEPTCGLASPQLQKSIPAWFDPESKSKLVLVFWKTFPPVRHLLLPPTPGALDVSSSLECQIGLRKSSSTGIEVVDLMGAPTEQVDEQIASLNLGKDMVALLISPSYAIKRLKHEQEDIALSTPLLRFGPHLHMDDVGVAYQMGAEGFKLEVREIKSRQL